MRFEVLLLCVLCVCLLLCVGLVRVLCVIRFVLFPEYLFVVFCLGFCEFSALCVVLCVVMCFGCFVCNAFLCLFLVCIVRFVLCLMFVVFVCFVVCCDLFGLPCLLLVCLFLGVVWCIVRLCLYDFGRVLLLC